MRRGLTVVARRRLAIAVLGCLGGVSAVVGLAQAAGVWLNTTGSMPRGLWQETAGAVQAGAIVLLCLPDSPAVRLAAARGYLGPGPCPNGLERVLKPVAAMEGDAVEVSAAGISVGGVLLRNSAALGLDTRGRGLPAVRPGRYRVAPGQLWLISEHDPRSFDSRYFGPVPVTAVRSVVRPLWVEG